VAGVGFIGAQALSQQVAGSRYIYIPGDARRYVPYHPPPEIDDGRVVPMNDGSRLYFHRSIWQYEDGRHIDPIIEDFWRRRWIRYGGYLRHWLALFALPGLVFIIVYALLWVIDGFGKAV
jgi:hypothetical protein